VTGALARADRAVLRVLRTRLHGRALERSAIVYTSVGEFGAIWIVASVAGAALDQERRDSWLAVAALVPATLGANYLVKIAVRRRRPRLAGLPPLGREPATFSFPSGHAATSFAAARRIGTLVPLARSPLVLAAALMALTRPYLGLHYPSDALAGAALGAVLARAR
jgi:membrane-associated phospholipid phosphatase